MAKIPNAVINIIAVIAANKNALCGFLILTLLILALAVMTMKATQGLITRTNKMPKFSQESFSRLSTCDHDLQVLFYEIIKTFDCTILDGFRSEVDQNIAFKAGNSKLPWPKSKHNSHPAHAVDVAPYPVDYKNTKRLYWFAGYVLGVAQKLRDEGKMTRGVRYGGDWDSDKEIDDESFRDLTHFELID
jgi:peptidoglycan L-alanyl-D-glutamate endopeptidase CwlK